MCRPELRGKAKTLHFPILLLAECASFVPANIKCCAHGMTCMAPEACKFIHSSIDEGVKTRSLFHPNVLENVRMCLNVPECATNVRSNELFRSGKYQVLRS